MFNFGLHNGPCNGANTTIPGGAATSAEYAGELVQIADKLTKYVQNTPAGEQKAKLLFALTSPMLCDAGSNAIVVELNKQAAKIMANYTISTVDPYKAIVGKCGAVPQAACFGSNGCFCPHCPGHGGAGYSWLANTTLAPAIRSLL